MSIASTSECLPNTKVDVERAGLFGLYEFVSHRITCSLLDIGKYRRIQVIAKIQPDRPYWRLVQHAETNRVRHVVVIAKCRIRRVRPNLIDRIRSLSAQTLVLVPSQQAIEHVVSISKHVSHVVKNRETQVVLHERKCGWRKSQLEAVQKQRRTAKGEPSNRVARA